MTRLFASIIAAAVIGFLVGVGGQIVFGYSNAVMYLITGGTALIVSIALPILVEDKR